MLLPQLNMVKPKAVQETRLLPLERQKVVLMLLPMGKLKALRREVQPPLKRQKMVLMLLHMGKLKTLQSKELTGRQSAKWVDSLMENRLPLRMKENTNFMHMAISVLQPPRNSSENREILNSSTFMI